MHKKVGYYTGNQLAYCMFVVLGPLLQNGCRGYLLLSFSNFLRITTSIKHLNIHLIIIISQQAILLSDSCLDLLTCNHVWFHFKYSFYKSVECARVSTKDCLEPFTIGESHRLVYRQPHKNGCNNMSCTIELTYNISIK